MARHRFVGVTYGEFQSLYLHGRMQAPSARLVPLGIRRDGRPSRQAKDVSRLIASLPELTLDDQEGVLILDLGPGRIARDVLARDIQQVIPATARARRILEPRLEPLGVDLAQPHFEAAVLERWSQRNAANALDGGRALCDLLFEDGVSVGVPLQEAAEAAIRHLDRQDDRGTDAGVFVLGASGVSVHAARSIRPRQRQLSDGCRTDTRPPVMASGVGCHRTLP